VVEDALINHTINAILNAARIGKIGDGKIFVSTIREGVRIRKGEKGADAV
jgi:nitrogen regulatory protein P-II 1